MKLIISLAIMAGAVFATLSGCTLTPTQVGTAAQQVQQICIAGAPLEKEVAATATGASLMTYLQSACNADGTVAAQLAPNIAPSTPTWLSNVITGLQVAESFAPVLLPLL